jgi:hypothetical protein
MQQGEDMAARSWPAAASNQALGLSAAKLYPSHGQTKGSLSPSMWRRTRVRMDRPSAATTITTQDFHQKSQLKIFSKNNPCMVSVHTRKTPSSCTSRSHLAWLSMCIKFTYDLGLN